MTKYVDRLIDEYLGFAAVVSRKSVASDINQLCNNDDKRSQETWYQELLRNILEGHAANGKLQVS